MGRVLTPPRHCAMGLEFLWCLPNTSSEKCVNPFATSPPYNRFPCTFADSNCKIRHENTRKSKSIKISTIDYQNFARKLLIVVSCGRCFYLPPPLVFLRWKKVFYNTFVAFYCFADRVQVGEPQESLILLSSVQYSS